MMNTLALARAALALLTLAVPSVAVHAACALSGGAGNLSFGAYAPLVFPGKSASAHADSTGTVTVSCTGLTQSVTYTLKLGGGQSNDVFVRSMTGTAGGADMRYGIFVDANRSVVWGDGVSAGSFQGSIAAPGGTVSHTFYARAPGGQSSLRPGSYADQLLITLEYLP
jgi:spore coat protein U-like protein